MTEPPRRLDPTPAQRVEMAIERSAGGVGGSGTRYSRPVPNGGNRSYAHGIPAGGDAGQGLVKLSDDDYDVDWAASGGGFAPIAAVSFASTDATSPLVSPTVDYDLFSNAASYFTYSSGSDLLITGPGWYQTSLSVNLTGMTPGDLGYVEIDADDGGELNLIGTFFGNPSGHGFGHVSSMPFNLNYSGSFVTYTMFLPSGSIVRSNAYLLKLA